MAYIVHICKEKNNLLRQKLCKCSVFSVCIFRLFYLVEKKNQCRSIPVSSVPVPVRANCYPHFPWQTNSRFPFEEVRVYVLVSFYSCLIKVCDFGSRKPTPRAPHARIENVSPPEILSQNHDVRESTDTLFL